MIKRSLLVAVLLSGAAFPAAAQDIATRIFQMEERIRQLTGQVEELNFTVQQLQKQLGQKGQQGALKPPVQKKPAIRLEQNDVASADGSGIEVIEETPQQKLKAQGTQIIGAEDASVQDFTQGGNGTAAEGGDFGGQVIVPKAGAETAVGEQGAAASGDGIETVSLQPADTPDALYKGANEALLRRQFGEAEAGFRSFLAKHPDHSLAGSAQYWLGETFYVQGDVKQAAQNFLQAYKTYPKSRRAPDSLLKLGMSLVKMGQKEQACAALNSVGTEFPRAVEAKKRASAESKRAGC
jgi:tol-pal system protein YbgF